MGNGGDKIDKIGKIDYFNQLSFSNSKKVISGIQEYFATPKNKLLKQLDWEALKSLSTKARKDTWAKEIIEYYLSRKKSPLTLLNSLDFLLFNGDSETFFFKKLNKLQSKYFQEIITDFDRSGTSAEMTFRRLAESFSVEIYKILTSLLELSGTANQSAFKEVSQKLIQLKRAKGNKKEEQSLQIIDDFLCLLEETNEASMNLFKVMAQLQFIKAMLSEYKNTQDMDDFIEIYEGFKTDGYHSFVARELAGYKTDATIYLEDDIVLRIFNKSSNDAGSIIDITETYIIKDLFSEIGSPEVKELINQYTEYGLSLISVFHAINADLLKIFKRIKKGNRRGSGSEEYQQINEMLSDGYPLIIAMDKYFLNLKN